MEAQVTVRIPEELKRALDEASRKMRRKRSEIVRMALSAFLESGPSPGDGPAYRVRGLVGSLESGVPHLAERHREYIVESLKHGG
jgi:hypothetical protein